VFPFSIKHSFIFLKNIVVDGWYYYDHFYIPFENINETCFIFILKPSKIVKIGKDINDSILLFHITRCETNVCLVYIFFRKEIQFHFQVLEFNVAQKGVFLEFEIGNQLFRAMNEDCQVCFPAASCLCMLVVD